MNASITRIAVSKTIQPQLSPGNNVQEAGGYSIVRGPDSWSPVHGPRQDGPVTPGQVS